MKSGYEYYPLFPLETMTSFSKYFFVFLFSLHAVALCMEKEKGKEKVETCASPSSVHVYFNEDIFKKLQQLIAAEKTKIRAAIFSFNSPWFKDGLITAKKRGVDCSVVYEKDEAKRNFVMRTAISALVKNKILCIEANPRDNRFNYKKMHEKFIVFSKNKDDKPCLALSSANFTKHAPREDNAMIVTDDAEVIACFEQEFELMRGMSPEHKIPILSIPDMLKRRISAHVAPSIGSLLQHLIEVENKSIHAAFFRFSLVPVAEAMAKKTDLTRSLILDPGALSEENNNFEAVRYLIDAKASVFLYKIDQYHLMHHKFMIFMQNGKNKNPLVLFGSFNVTGQAHHANWEDMVCCCDQEVANKFKEEYIRMLELGVKKPLESVPKRGDKEKLTYRMDHTLDTDSLFKRVRVLPSAKELSLK